MASYKNIVEGVFGSLPNRFIANVEVAGKTVVCIYFVCGADE